MEGGGREGGSLCEIVVRPAAAASAMAVPNAKRQCLWSNTHMLK